MCEEEDDEEEGSEGRMKIIHTADWHWEAERLDKCQTSADFILSKLREINPDLHVIAGDYWNRRQTLTSASAFRPAIDTLTKLAAICPTVIIKGNNEHDAEGSIEWLRDLETVHPIYATERAGSIWLTNAGLFVDNAPTAPAALIHSFPYPTKQYFLADKPGLSIDESNALIQEAIRQIMLGFGAISEDADCPVILVAHCNVAGAQLSTGQALLGQDIILSKRDLALAGADYVALGHIHKAQEIAPGICYSGSIYHNNFGEVEKKQFNLVRLDGHDIGPSIGFIEIPSRPLSLHDAAWDPRSGWCDEAEMVKGFEDWKGAELRIRVHLTKEVSSLITDEQIRSNYPDAYTYMIERIIVPDERIRSSEIVKAKSLRDKVNEWGKSIEREIPAAVLELADETERGCAI